MTDKQQQLEDIRLVVNLLGIFYDPDTEYKKKVGMMACRFLRMTSKLFWTGL